MNNCYNSELFDINSTSVYAMGTAAAVIIKSQFDPRDVSTLLLPERSDTKWLNERVTKSRKIFDGDTTVVQVVKRRHKVKNRARNEVTCTVRGAEKVKMHLLRSLDIAKLYNFASHSRENQLVSYDKWYYDCVRSLPMNQKNIILQQCYDANRSRADLINNRFYHGVVNDSFVSACERYVTCEYRLFEIHNGRFVGHFHYMCKSGIKKWSYYTIEVTNNKHIWHSPELAKELIDRLELSEILHVFINQWIPEQVLEWVHAYYSERWYPGWDRYLADNHIEKICNCASFNGGVLVTQPTAKGSSRFHQSGVWSLKRLCAFFVVNFFYADKSLIRAILPPRHFAALEETCKVYTHSWNY
jgi:hypothetical protein